MALARRLDLQESQMSASAEALEVLAEAEEACRRCTGPEECRAPRRFVRPAPVRTDRGLELDALGELCEPERRRREWAVQQARVTELFRSAKFPKSADRMTLETFRVGPGTERAYRLAGEVAAWAGKPGPCRGLLLSGPTGCGKTHLAISIMRRWLAAGVPCLFETLPELMDDLRGSQHTAAYYDEAMDLVGRIPFAVFDDLQLERVTEFVVDRLFIVANRRELEGALTIVTTNVRTAEELRQVLGDRVVSRLLALCQWVDMDGPDGHVDRWWERP